MAGRGNSAEIRARTPRDELERMRAMRGKQDSEARARIIEAMLQACGKLGYRKVTVGDVIEGCNGYRMEFYRHFANKADCYAVAYETAIEWLCAALLDAGRRQEGWRAGLHAALDELARFARERPALARGLLVEVNVAGGRALARREEVFERLSRALDSARRETKSRHSPPPVTASFIVGTIESAVTTALLEGQPERFAEAVPDLGQLAVTAYFGEEARGEATAELAVGGIKDL